MKDSFLRSPVRRSPPSRLPKPSQARLQPVELARWLDARADRIVDRWLTEVHARNRTWDRATKELIERLLGLLVEMLPETLGPYHGQVEPVWVQTAELYGSVAARRGLAAGEVIEELQLLRESLLRLLFDSSAAVENGLDATAQRDLLRLNRIVDRAVTQASVGHTDVLFFTLFRGSGVPDTLDDSFVAEVHDQLQGLRQELLAVTRRLGD